MLNTKIGWCDSTWNPVTGCGHGCPYCYAAEMARRFGGHDHDADGKPTGTYCAIGMQVLERPLHITRQGKLQVAPYPWFFAPTLHAYKLDEPHRWRAPRRVFVSSMGDLFGDWVPDSWIRKVMQAACRAPQHQYLFLTKNPRRYLQDDLLPHAANMWFGASITSAEEAERVSVTMAALGNRGYNTFLSIEPLHGDLAEGLCLAGIGWVIVGAETGRRKEKVVPKWDWVASIIDRCICAGVPVYLKDSLAEMWAQGQAAYTGEGEELPYPLIQQFPAELLPRGALSHSRKAGA